MDDPHLDSDRTDWLRREHAFEDALRQVFPAKGGELCPGHPIRVPLDQRSRHVLPPGATECAECAREIHEGVLRLFGRRR